MIEKNDDNTSCSNYNQWFKLPKAFHWNMASSREYTNAVKSKDIQNRIKTFSFYNFEKSVTGIEAANKQLTDI